MLSGDSMTFVMFGVLWKKGREMAGVLHCQFPGDKGKALSQESTFPRLPACVSQQPALKSSSVDAGQKYARALSSREQLSKHLLKQKHSRSVLNGALNPNKIFSTMFYFNICAKNMQVCFLSVRLGIV